MARLQRQSKQATFFIRVLNNPIIREEFRVSENGVVFIKSTRSGEATSRLKVLCNAVRLSLRTSKQDSSSQDPQVKEAPSTSSDRSDNVPNQNVDNNSGLVEFLQAQKAEAEWIQGILNLQVNNLESPILSQPWNANEIWVDPAHALSLTRSRRNWFEIKYRAERLRQAIELLSGTDEYLNSRLVVDLIGFLRSQAADMTFGAKDTQRRSLELADPNLAQEIVEQDPCTQAIVQKEEYEGRAEQYHRIADALSRVGREISVKGKFSFLKFWKKKIRRA
ncbi:hypothetical protein MMC22_003644 [Lobaria immixta]|nr:hypothetical protein [Lobaria immixta]